MYAFLNKIKKKMMDTYFTFSDNRKSAQRREYFNDYKLELITLVRTSDLSIRSAQLIKNLFSIPTCHILLWNDEQGAFLFQNTGDGQARSPNRKWRLFDAFIIWIIQNDQIVEKVDLSLTIPEAKTRKMVDHFFEKTNSSMLVPLVLNSSLLAILCLGHKSNGRSFSMDEYSIIKEFKNITSIAFGNAILYERLTELNQSLELKVKERTQELEDAQGKLVHTEKLASLGVMVAGIAHEINTPSSVIYASVEKIMGKVDQFYQLFIGVMIDKHDIDPALLQEFRRVKAVTSMSSNERYKLKRKIKKKLNEMNQISQEECDTKADFISCHTLTYQQENNICKMNYDAFQAFTSIFYINQNLNNIKISIQSIIKIVTALKHYSRLDQAQKDFARLEEGLSTTLIILNNELKNKSEVYESYEKLTPIHCYVSELNQVWTNIIMNSIQACSQRGRIDVSLKAIFFKREVKSQMVYDETQLKQELTADKNSDYRYQMVTVEDNGLGIPKKIKNKIFDPFFTTKVPGEGTGLGLGIVKNIIDKHNGFISFSSKPGRTRFNIFIPAKEKTLN